MPFVSLSDASARRYDLTIVGSGPAGLALAQGALDRGLSVLILEQGQQAPTSPDDATPVGKVRDPDRHVLPQIASCQALGGTFHWWGGRSVPLDPVDFTAPGGHPWPISYEEYAEWIPSASRFLGVDSNYSRPIPGWENLDGLSANMVEHLCADVGLTSPRTREALDRADILLASPVVELVAGTDGSVCKLKVHNAGAKADVPVQTVALCCGGLESTRLLLSLQRQLPHVAGGDGGALGRSYMGHLTGAVATLELERPGDWAAFAYSGTPRPSRRRLMLTEADAMAKPHIAIAFWLENIRTEGPEHGVSIHSLRHLIGRLAGRTSHGSDLNAHLRNVFFEPASLLSETKDSLRRRLRPKDRPADKLRRSRLNRYRLAYHSEHYPNAESQVHLTDETDQYGRPTLDIDFHFSSSDFDAVAKAHRALAARLEASGLAKLSYEDGRLSEQVASFARDGYHQLGMTRMSDEPSSGVVDRNLRVHGLDNVYTVSTGVFPTSGQANPTLSIVCFSLRLAAHLEQLRPV
ncbi:MAG: GMC oxidoreductase [Pseudomonadota bacterium]